MMPLSLSQNALISQFIDYIDIVKKRAIEQEVGAENTKRREKAKPPLSEEEIENIKERNKPLSAIKKGRLKFGLCNGFSAVHSYMSAIDKLDWWKALLDCISHWDRKEESLQAIISLVHERTEKKSNEMTLDYYFTQAINFVFFHQATDFQNGIKKLTQDNLLEMGTEWFFAAEGKIQLSEKFSEKECSVEKLERLLDNNTFAAKNTLFLITFYFKKMSLIEAAHACSLRYDPCIEKWFCYDPSDSKGEEQFPDVATLYYTMNERYSANIKIEIASFDSTFHLNHSRLAHIPTREEKLISLESQLLCLRRYYQHKYNKKEKSGFDAGLFGKCFSVSARLNATEKLLEEVRFLQANPSSGFDKTQFFGAERNGKLGVIFQKLKGIHLPLETLNNTRPYA
ncbi:MAG: hypothetical protein NTU49_03300 [Gammaproteobacteria bacterium]|nr:hypothetical protein [Gammaproteobacteria bacterium]